MKNPEEELKELREKYLRGEIETSEWRIKRYELSKELEKLL